MAQIKYDFNLAGYRSSWRIRQDFMTMSYSIEVQFHVYDNGNLYSKEDFYGETVFQLAKALEELKGYLLGTQNP